MGELLVVQSKLKGVVDTRIAGNVAEALSKKVEEILKKAAERAKANKRGTVMIQDL